MKDRSRVENERDDTANKHQKLQKKCERLQDEVNRHRDIVTQLKAKLMDYGEQQVGRRSSLLSTLLRVFAFDASHFHQRRNPIYIETKKVL